MVGDPSGKSDERPMLGLDQIDRNVEGIARQLSRFLAFEGEQRRADAQQRRLAPRYPADGLPA